MKKIAVVINKNWEAEPVLNALLNGEIRPASLPFPKVVNTPKDKFNKMDQPRCIIRFGPEDNSSLEVTVWCIQDLMYFNVPTNPNQSSSSSEEKYRVLKLVLSASNPELVIAIGTAGFIMETSYNGSIVIGANFFVHNGHPGNPKSNLDLPDFGKVLVSNVNEKIFDIFNQDFKYLTESRCIPTPRNPASKAVCIGSKVFTALSSVNVTDYSEYNWVDHEAIDNFKVVEKHLPISSIETTHGVIKLATQAPIVFVSAITDRLGHFDMEVNPSQNYVASFNAGIVLGQFLMTINDLVLKGFQFSKQAI